MSQYLPTYVSIIGLESDLSLCAMLLLTSPTLLFSPAIAFKKITIFTADMDMWMWVTKMLLWPAWLSCWNGLPNYQISMMAIIYQIISYGTCITNSNIHENFIFWLWHSSTCDSWMGLILNSILFIYCKFLFIFFVLVVSLLYPDTGFQKIWWICIPIFRPWSEWHANGY